MIVTEITFISSFSTASNFSDFSNISIVITNFYCAMHYCAKRGLAIACRLSVRPLKISGKVAGQGLSKIFRAPVVIFAVAQLSCCIRIRCSCNSFYALVHHMTYARR